MEQTTNQAITNIKIRNTALKNNQEYGHVAESHIDAETAIRNLQKSH
jgi:hypothetical protein